ncbi:hypothetical protein KW430_07460 [Vibrio fluvialis]|nr:hypothetical protein [Vibrio fluvialis]MBY7917740.1 hypothetical protein [Vibrio fluvialis]
MHYNKLREQMFSEKTINIANSIMNKDAARDSESESMESNTIERCDILEAVHVKPQETPKKVISFKDFNKQHPTPPAIERMQEQARKEQWNIIIEQKDGDSLIEYESQLMRDKSTSSALNERAIVDHSFPNSRVDLKRLRSMTLYAASGTSDMSSRVLVFNALNELHGLMIDESTRTIATAYGAKQFLQALKQLSSIQSMVQELIRMNKRDQQKNMSAVSKIRAAKNKGDVEQLVQIIAGTLAFNLSNSLKDIK